MEEKIKKIKELKKKLDNKEIDEIGLSGVYPSLLEKVFGRMDQFTIESKKCYFYGDNEEYNFYGNMFYGTANIIKQEDAGE